MPSIPNKNVDIIACFLATDDTYLYVRIDIGDDRKSSLFRPHNFKWNTWTTYQLDVFGFDTFFFQLGTHYEEGKNQWVTLANRTDLRPPNEVLETVTGYSCRLKGASLESRFPLSFLAPRISHGVERPAQVGIGYSRDGSWVSADTTELRNVVF